MASVVSVVIDRDTGGERRRVNYTITLEDNDAVQHEFKVGPVMADADFDANAYGVTRSTQMLEEQAEQEDEGTINLVYEQGGNALTLTLNPKWSTSKRIAKKLIRWMMREKDPRIVIFLEPLIDYLQANYNATQMATWLDITVAQVLKVNSRVNAILSDVGTVKAQLLVFDAEQEEID